MQKLRDKFGGFVSLSKVSATTSHTQVYMLSLTGFDGPCMLLAFMVNGNIIFYSLRAVPCLV